MRRDGTYSFSARRSAWEFLRIKNKSEADLEKANFFLPRSYLLRKPINIPSADTSDVLDDNLEAREVIHSDCVECNIKKNKGPLEERVDRIGWLVSVCLTDGTGFNSPPGTLCTLCWMKK